MQTSLVLISGISSMQRLSLEYALDYILASDEKAYNILHEENLFHLTRDELLGLADDAQANLVFRSQSLDMDVLYRSGETEQGIATYTPRLVSVDFQGSLGSVSSHGTLYNQMLSVPSSVSTWTGNVSTHVSEPHKKNLFLQSLYEDEPEKMVPNAIDRGMSEPQHEILQEDIAESLENSVQFWTDFSKVHYHPQSLYELNGLYIGAQELDNYGIGRESMSEGQRGDEINERLHFFLEECDHVQGIQFIVDESGGFSGVAASLLENIADEYTNTPVLLYTVRSPGSYMNSINRKQTLSSNLHDAVSFTKLSSLCKLIVPIGLPSLSTSKYSRLLRIEDEKPYHSSAVYASAIHSISLPFLMKRVGPTGKSCYESGAMDMYENIQMLTGQARQNIVVTLDAAMPAPSVTGARVDQSLLGNLHSLTVDIAEDVEDLYAVESMTIHGLRGSGSHPALVSEVTDAVDAAYEHAVTRPMFSHLSVARCPLPIPLPFPSIFGNLVGQHGELLTTSVSGTLSRGSLHVHSIPMAARLRSSKAVLPFLENRLRNLRRFGIEQGALGAELLRNWGFTRDEVEDIGEELSKLITTLDPRSLYSSDSD